MRMRIKLIYMTYQEVKEHIEKGYTNLIIPIGTLEAHGPHLPIGTDIIIPEKIAEEIAERIKALIAPSIQYGITTSLLCYHGGTSILDKNLEQTLIEIIRNFHAHGFKLFILINGHGGNIEPIKNAQRTLWKNYRIKSIAIHWWIYVKEITQNVFGEIGGHAGVDETAIMLATHPELVKRINTTDEVFVFRNGLDVYPCPGSIILYRENEGYPRFDVELAKKYFKAVVDSIVSDILDLMDKLR